VAFPPGCAKLSTNPASTGSVARRTNWKRVGNSSS
jgi:hypothetical protein